MPIRDFFLGRLFFSFAATLLAALIAFPALAQSVNGWLPLPPGQVIVGPVARGQTFSVVKPGYPGEGSTVPSIVDGVEANVYVFPLPDITPATLPFVNSAFSPASVVLTSVPTQYVRFYNPGAGGNAAGPWLVPSNQVRGLTVGQIRDVLALPTPPTMQTIVLVPAGTCLLTGVAGPIAGWGAGGAVQEYLIGKSSPPGCGAGADPKYLSTSNFINRQAIGAFALAYSPRAFGGNAGAVAYALDHVVPPPLFTDMDSVYNALDILNFGASGPLRDALAQLDGEIYADVPSVAIAAGRMFLDAIRDQAQLARDRAAQALGDGARLWANGFGGGGGLFGYGDVHGLRVGGGGVAFGLDYRFGPALRAGVAAGYLRTGFGANGFPGAGGMDSFFVGPYASYADGPWRLDGALAYGFNSANVGRSISFYSVFRSASAQVDDHALLARAEAGYRITLDERTGMTPFASFQSVAVWQPGFSENGAGAVSLNVDGHSAVSALGALGVELGHELPVGLPAPLAMTVRAGWAHDFVDVSRSVVAGFQGLPDSIFTVDGARWPRNAVSFGARLVLTTEIANVFFRYDGEAAGRAALHSATVGLRIAF